MKIIAKQGSELEKLLKQMNERLLREQDEAKDMIQDQIVSVMFGRLASLPSGFIHLSVLKIRSLFLKN